MSVIPLPRVALDDVRDRAVRLYTFLREYTQLRASTALTTEGYDEVIWLADVPGLPGSVCAAVEPTRDGEVWLEVRKPRLLPPPRPRESILDPRPRPEPEPEPQPAAAEPAAAEPPLAPERAPAEAGRAERKPERVEMEPVDSSLVKPAVPEPAERELVELKPLELPAAPTTTALVETREE